MSHPSFNRALLRSNLVDGKVELTITNTNTHKTRAVETYSQFSLHRGLIGAILIESGHVTHVFYISMINNFRLGKTDLVANTSETVAHYDNWTDDWTPIPTTEGTGWLDITELKFNPLDPLGAPIYLKGKSEFNFTSNDSHFEASVNITMGNPSLIK
ncbi:hypothetical protein AB7M33_002595 [Pseudomonas sp. Y3 TE3536]